MNKIQYFLILCSGSSISVLNKTKTDWNKHAGIGGVILFTGIFASLSSGYALYSVFDNYYYASGFGLLWGLMIFNLDRFIVSSMRKTGSFGNQFLMALPRLILAFFLGIVIAKPLELKIFEKEIDKQLNVIINRNKQQLQDSMNVRFMAQTKPYNSERDSIYSRIKSLRTSYDSASVELEKEILGKTTSKTSGKAGFGSNAKRKQEIKLQKEKELNEYVAQNKTNLDSLDKKVNLVYDNLRDEIKSTSKTENKYNGFLARMQALDELSTLYKIIAIASFFIMGIFIILEMSPVLVKLMAPNGPYDYMMEKTEYSFKSYSNESIEKESVSSKYRLGKHEEKNRL